MTRLIITHRPTWRLRLIQGAAVLTVILASWGLFEYGRYSAGFDGIAAHLKDIEHANQMRALEQSIGLLREQKAVLESATQIDSEAYKLLEGEMSGLRDEILELNKELAFYRGIVSSKGESGGLRLQRFEVSPGGTPNTYRYQLVLTQTLTNSAISSGLILLDVEGISGQTPKTLSLAEVTGGSSKELSFRFKYFQELVGDIILPPGFTPKRVVVTVNPRGTEELRKSFEWPS